MAATGKKSTRIRRNILVDAHLYNSPPPSSDRQYWCGAAKEEAWPVIIIGGSGEWFRWFSLNYTQPTLTAHTVDYARDTIIIIICEGCPVPSSRHDNVAVDDDDCWHGWLASVYVVLYCGRWMDGCTRRSRTPTTKRILLKELSLSYLFSIISLSNSLRVISLLSYLPSAFPPFIDKDAAGGGLSKLVLSVLVCLSSGNILRPKTHFHIDWITVC